MANKTWGKMKIENGWSWPSKQISTKKMKQNLKDTKKYMDDFFNDRVPWKGTPFTKKG